MELILLSLILVVVTSAGLILLRDVLILRDQVLKGGSSDRLPITPLVKNILSATEAVTSLPSLLGYEQGYECSVSEVREDVLKEMCQELKEAVGLDCVIAFGSAAERCEYSGTSARLLSCFLACRYFLFDGELERFLRLPFCGSCDSLAAFGIFGIQGYTYILVEKFSKNPIGLVIFGSEKPIEAGKISRWTVHLEKELELRQRLHDLHLKIEELANKSALLQRKLASVAHDFKSPIQTLNLVLSQFPDETADNLVKVGRSSLDLLHDLVERCLSDSDSDDYFSDVRVSTIIDELVGVMTPVLKHMKKHFDVSVDEDLFVRVNQTDFKRIMLNLISNSAKYSGGNKVIIRGGRFDQGVIIAVEDCDSDLDESFIQRLEMRYLLDLARRDERFPNAQGFGTGLLNVALLCARNDIQFCASRSEHAGLRVELLFR